MCWLCLADARQRCHFSIVGSINFHPDFCDNAHRGEALFSVDFMFKRISERLGELHLTVISSKIYLTL